MYLHNNRKSKGVNRENLELGDGEMTA